MHIEKQHAKFADTDTDTYVQTVSHFLIKRLEIKKCGVVYQASGKNLGIEDSRRSMNRPYILLPQETLITKWLWFNLYVT